MEAIIRSSKPLPIGPGDDSLSTCTPLTRTVQRLSDRLVPLFYTRWMSFAVIVGFLGLRIALIQRHFFTLYILAIYVLNQVLLFVSPATEDDDLPGMSQLADRGNEYRPFVRALSEFRLWWRGFIAMVVAFLASFVDYLDLEVDGQALLLYFVVLFGYTMKQQITHMVKHGYVPWNTSKKATARRGDGKKDATYDV